MWTRQWRSWLKWIPTLKPHLPRVHTLPMFFSCAQGHGDGCARKQLQLIFIVAVFSSFDLWNYSNQPDMVSVLWSEQSLCPAFSFTSFPQATPTSWLFQEVFDDPQRETALRTTHPDLPVIQAPYSPRTPKQWISCISLHLPFCPPTAVQCHQA